MHRIAMACAALALSGGAAQAQGCPEIRFASAAMSGAMSGEVGGEVADGAPMCVRVASGAGRARGSNSRAATMPVST